MKKIAAALVTSVVAATVLAGCGGDSPYCAAVKENRTALDSFGEKRTEKGFTTYAEALRAIATTAPDTVKDDWSKLGAVTDGVLKAHDKVGLPLQSMSDTAKVAALDADDLARLNKAYDAFNDTAKQRKAVVADVKKSCEITLK
ncbi:MAG: hypothetical protein ABWX74_04715 [Aeromicrobium sp.]